MDHYRLEMTAFEAEAFDRMFWQFVQRNAGRIDVGFVKLESTVSSGLCSRTLTFDTDALRDELLASCAWRAEVSGASNARIAA